MSTKTKKNLRIALVHDYLREYGGAERVLEALHELYPEAPVYTAFVDRKALGIHWQRFTDWDIRTTWLARFPLIKKLYSPLRIFSAKAFESLDLREYDVVISSSNAYMAKAVRVPNGVHICYCHTPPRSLYGYTTMTNWKKNPVFRLGGFLINHFMRVIDYYVAQEVDHFIANSQETRRRITKFYRRESTVINPPVDVPEATPSAKKREYYLYVNRLALAKHPELAVEVCSELELPLKVVGTGPMLDELKAQAGPSVKFFGAVTDEKLHTLYANAKALLYPVEDEDFGIVPVEAMGHGVPVIAHKSGGPRETVLDDKTGILFEELNNEGLQAAIRRFENTPFSSDDIHAHAKKFTKERFQQQVKKFVEGKSDE